MMEIDVENQDLESSALTKAQLAELLFDHIGLNKRESKDMVDAFFELIVQELVSGNDVKLSGFGNFQIRTKAPRPGRNRGYKILHTPPPNRLRPLAKSAHGV